MCGRSSLYKEPGELLESFGLPPRLAGYQPSYNIAPSQNQWAILKRDDGSLDTRKLRWGLIPSWANDPSIGAKMINARAETLADKPSYRDALRHRRCLILTDGYYEWTKTGGGNTPIRFQMAGRKAFVLAGLWERWEKGKSPIESCTIITTAAGETTKPFHDRMPVILQHADSLKWLHADNAGTDVLALLRAYSGDDLEMFEVSRTVNNPANDTEDCVRPVRSFT